MPIRLPRRRHHRQRPLVLLGERHEGVRRPDAVADGRSRAGEGRVGPGHRFDRHSRRRRGVGLRARRRHGARRRVRPGRLGPRDPVAHGRGRERLAAALGHRPDPRARRPDPIACRRLGAGPLDAVEARRLGLVDEISEAGGALALACERAHRLAALPAAAAASVKPYLRQIANSTALEADRIAAALFLQHCETEQARHTLAKFGSAPSPHAP